MELRQPALAEGWRALTVEQIAARSSNALATGPFGSSIGSRFFRPEGVPVIRGGNLSADGATRLVDDGLVFISEKKAVEFARSTVVSGDLVFTCWGTINQVGLISSGATYPLYVISNKQMKLTPDSNKADSLFLFYLFCSPPLQRTILNQGIGSSIPGFNLGQLRRMHLLMPPLPEQRAIAAALSDVDVLIAKLDQLITKKRDLKQAAMQQLLTGKTRLPGFRGEWVTKRLGAIADVKTGPFGSSLHESDYVREGTPIITVEHLGAFGVEHTNLPLVSDVDRQRLRAYTLELGDIVFSRVGSVDRNALVRPAEVGWLFSGRLLRVRPDEQEAFAPFLSHQFYGEAFISAVRSMAVGQTMACLNTQILKGIPVVLPPLPEQSAIADVLSDMDTELTALETRREKTRNLKQGMMQELLTGRTRLV